MIISKYWISKGILNMLVFLHYPKAFNTYKISILFKNKEQ